jgi:tripartite-type tricarboxylate transporter receptor subunit TctC
MPLGHGTRHWCTALIATAFFAGMASGAYAQAAANFYAGRTISLIVPYDPGGYYDTGARLMARFLGRHIAGHPAVMVENQPSAGGIGLAQRFAAGQKNDGTVLGVLQRSIPQYALVGYQSTSFDPRKLIWIGSLSSYTNDSYVLFVNASNPATSLAALKTATQVTRLGAGRSSGSNLVFSLLAKQALSLNIDAVRGYGGSAPIFLAEQNHEVDGFFEDLSGVKAGMAAQWNARQILPIVQFGRKTRLDELSDVPTAREAVTDPQFQALLDFAELPFSMALPIAAPAGVPAERVKILQDAFLAMGSDPAFLEAADKMHYVVSPISGVEVANQIDHAAAASDEVKARFKELISQ